MAVETSAYGMRVTTALGFEEAVLATRDALKQQGFGVLTEVDVQKTMKEKLGVDFPPYLILGACHPPSAYQSLTLEREIGLLLPCNVIVYADSDRVVVAAIDPTKAMSTIGNTSLADVATAVRGKLEAALLTIAGA